MVDMLKDKLLKNMGKNMNIKTKYEYEYKNIKLVEVYYDYDDTETWVARFDYQACILEIVIDGIESIEILD